MIFPGWNWDNLCSTSAYLLSEKKSDDTQVVERIFFTRVVHLHFLSSKRDLVHVTHRNMRLHACLGLSCFIPSKAYWNVAVCFLFTLQHIICKELQLAHRTYGFVLASYISTSIERSYLSLAASGPTTFPLNDLCLNCESKLKLTVGRQITRKRE